VPTFDVTVRTLPPSRYALRRDSNRAVAREARV